MTIYRRKRLKDKQGNYMVTPSTVDMVFTPEGYTQNDINNVIEQELNILNATKIDRVELAEGMMSFISNGKQISSVNLQQYDTRIISGLVEHNNTEIITLNTELYQKVVVTNDSKLELPNVINFTRIHLYLQLSGEAVIELPKIKYSGGVIIGEGTYEVIFTNIGNEWIGNIIVYK